MDGSVTSEGGHALGLCNNRSDANLSRESRQPEFGARSPVDYCLFIFLSSCYCDHN